MSETLTGIGTIVAAGPPADSPPSLKTRCTLVLDTSVLIADPTCLSNLDHLDHDYQEDDQGLGLHPGFNNCDVVIPLTVVEELDGLKTRPDDVGRAARTALRTLEEMRISAGGSLADPTPLGRSLRPSATAVGGSTIRIEINGIQHHLLVEHGLDPTKEDNRIIGAALGQAMHSTTVVVSNDAALRIKAAHLGLEAREHRPTGQTIDRRDSGWVTIQTDETIVDEIYAHGSVHFDQLTTATTSTTDPAPLENQYAVLRYGSQSALVRRRADRLIGLGHTPPEAWGLRPRSKEQRFALDLLLDPTVSVVALDGRAGTGKTLVAIAAGLEQVVERRMYERLAVYRPLVPVGRADVGFLPGGLDEKLDPWMSAIHDAIVALTDHRSDMDAHRLVDELVHRNQLSLESVTFLRGRSLHRQFVVVDEAQNLEPTTLKTVLTRVGEGTKVVFTGDTTQIDAPYLGASNNALAVLIQAFAGQSCFGHVTLAACERSEVASLAAELL